MDDHQRGLKTKFTSADANSDGYLDKKEFGVFVHPQRHKHMVEHLVRDQLLAYDKDKNGVISRREYLGMNMYNKTSIISNRPPQPPCIIASRLIRTSLKSTAQPQPMVNL